MEAEARAATRHQRIDHGETPAQTNVDYEDTDKMRFFRETFKETATVKVLGGPIEWETLKGHTLDGKQGIMTKKMLATLRHGHPRRSIMCE